MIIDGAGIASFHKYLALTDIGVHSTLLKKVA
jgi:hypothetical protein